jgi:hypothetical protein
MGVGYGQGMHFGDPVDPGLIALDGTRLTA